MDSLYNFITTQDGGKKKKSKKKWSTLVHNGVLFSPPYRPHGIPVLFDGHEIKLPPEAEEVATLYARCLDTEYVTNGRFNRNFWKSWKPLVYPLGVTSLDKCDFTRIHQHLLDKKLADSNRTTEEKKAAKEKREKALTHFRAAYLDGHEEHVGNFLVEPKGIFVGRGCHPKLGTVKARVMPSDLTINIGKSSPIPKIYYLSRETFELVEMEGHNWGEIIHDNRVEWIASWRDTVMGKRKYVWLSDHSRFKSASDMKKFDLARRLKKRIHRIRDENMTHYRSNDRQMVQLATATYLIDKLALRVGNEKGDDEADTVGLTSLRVEHINFDGDETITLDFLGKDSMRYYNTVKVDQIIYHNLMSFTSGKQPSDPLFDLVGSSDLNEYLQQYMKGLTAKVFRTFNATNLFQTRLRKIRKKFPMEGREKVKIETVTETGSEAGAETRDGPVLTPEEMKQIMEMYERASIEVAKYCNHRKKVVKSLKKQLQKIKDTIEQLRRDKKRLQAKKNRTKTIAKRITRYNQKIKVAKARLALKNEMKDISLTTSKVNYIDPRVVVSFAKYFNIPLGKFYSSSLLKKFNWAFETDVDYRF